MMPLNAQATTLETVRARGHLLCGISDGLPGFSQSSDRGEWSGFEIEFCYALAAAVLGKKDAVKFRPLSTTDRFTALTSGEVDVLARATTWTLSRDTELGVRFTDVLFYDGQGFLVRRSEPLTSALELSGASICAMSGAYGEQGLAEYFGARDMRYQAVTSDRWDALVKTYMAGGCSALSGDISMLALERTRLPNAKDHVLLPELVTKEPYAPVVRRGDDGWFAIVRWTAMALIAAEEFGITSANVDAMRDGTSLDVRRFLGLEANLGLSMGLPRDWAYQIVKQVGNYGEIFDRSLGGRSVFRLERGMNGLWSQGGLMYAAPFR